MDVEKIIEGIKENKEELIKKAFQCQSAKALFVLASENGIKITEPEAEDIFDMIHGKTGELSDDELDAVAGGFDDCSGKYDKNDRWQDMA